MNPVLARLLAQRKQQLEFIDQLLAQIESENRDLVDAERSNITAARQRVEELDAQIKPLEEFEATRAAHTETVSQAIPTAPRKDKGDRHPLGVQERQYKYPSAGHFLVDYLAGRGTRSTEPDLDARQRAESALGRSIEPEARALAKQTTAETPGLLPADIVGEILSDLDAARPFLTSIGIKPLGTVRGKKFSRPVITQHTQVGKQAAEKSELPSRQLKVGSIDFSKDTYGGALNISRQDIDWTDPSAWNAIVTDLQDVYGVETEDAAAQAFAAAITQKTTIPKASGEGLKAWVKALYSSAVMAVTANGTQRASSLRLPNTIWTSVDMWGSLGSMLTANRTLLQQAGASSPTAFDGDILDIKRVMAPGLPAGTMIIGRSSQAEAYEERIGLLQAVEPSILGVEVAYGGYFAFGVLDATAFAKVEVATE